MRPLSQKSSAALVSILGLLACLFYNLILLAPWQNYLYSSLAKIFLFLGMAYFSMKLIPHQSMRELLSLKGGIKTLKISFWLGLAATIVIIVSYVGLSSYLSPRQILSGLLAEGITKETYPFVFINIVFINAFLEEFFFRGFLFFALYRMGYPKYAFWFSALLFALYHTVMIYPWFSFPIFALCIIGLFGAGLMFNQVGRLCQNIYGPLLIHLGANLGINLIGAYLFLFS